MPDKTSLGISEPLRQFIEDLAKKVTLEGKPFDNNQKEWLRCYCEAEGFDYETLETKLNMFFKSIKELEEHESQGTEWLLGLLAKDCYVPDTLANKLIVNATMVRAKKEADRKARAKKAREEEERERIRREEAEHKAKEETSKRAKIESPLLSSCRIEYDTLYPSGKVSGKVLIPSVVGEKNVIAIGSNAFAYQRIESVIIPDTVRRIGKSAFEGCHTLKVVVLPLSMATIGEAAFMNCDKLSRIELPYKLETIAPRLFNGCKSLTGINIPDSVVSIGREAFRGCPLNSVFIPDSVRMIEEMAFYNCSNLTSLTISNKVARIEDFAFGNCTALRSIVIPTSVSTLSKYALSGCSNLKDISIGHKNYESIKYNIPSPNTTIHFID